tara:strand:- start:11995 stop:14319 length:2325 start_codon:yes stop_codon:yes gene_type:complete
MIKQNTRILAALLGATALSACGGGGGGGGYTPNNPSPIVNLNYTTPVVQSTVDPFAGADENSPFVGDTFVTDLDGDGANDDIVIAGRETMPFDGTVNKNKLSVHSFENGQLVDKTSQWFSGTDNEILGTEPDVKFADFFNTGKKDMIVAHSQDMASYGPATFFKNNGSNFTRVDIPTANIWSHGSDVGDLNNDGYKDIFLTDYGYNSTVLVNNQVNGFDAKVDSRGQFGDMRLGGSGAAIGNFMNNGGNNEIIVTDAQCPSNGNGASCDNTKKTKLYSVDFTGGGANYTWISDLPASNAVTEHHVRVVNHDYNEDGNADVIVFSLDSDGGQKLSEIQFLQNDGTGTFTDTTSTTLVGYQTNTSSTYKPRFFDINGDGKTDILVSGGTHDTNNSHQFLLKTTDNKYVAAYQNVLEGFMDDVASISGNTTLGSTVNIFEGDDGNKYLVTWASTALTTSDTKIQVFMSRLDGTTIAAGTAVNMIQNAWSYLSDAQAAQALVDTGQSFAGGTIIDINKAFQPIGTLTMNGLELNGSVYGFNVGDIKGQALDGIGRNYSVKLAQTNIDSDGATMYNSIASFNTTSKDGLIAGADNATQQFTLGQNMWTNANEVTGNGTTYSMHLSKLNSNPWIGFSGIWGEVDNTNIIDNVVTYKQGDFTARASAMHVKTNFQKGLITQVSDQFGVWGELGYKQGNLDLGAGVHPVLLNGDVTANVPTSVDAKGNINYTEHKFKLPTNINGYLKANYNFNLDTNTKIKVAGAVSQSGDNQANVSYNIVW